MFKSDLAVIMVDDVVEVDEAMSVSGLQVWLYNRQIYRSSVVKRLSNEILRKNSC